MKSRQTLRRASLALAFTVSACVDAIAPAAVLLPDGAARSSIASNGYQFTIVVDSERDGLDPFGFGCPAMNEEGTIAFHGVNSQFQNGIFRSNGRAITTIAVDTGQFGFISTNPSINDRGDVAFAANVFGGENAILRGRGGPLTTIAESEFGPYSFFGFDVSVNNAGNVAFKAELDDTDEGLFYGNGGPVTTVYLASTSQFQGNDVGPAINNAGQIAFNEDLDVGGSGMFLWNGSTFIPIATTNATIGGFLRAPGVNDAGMVALHAFVQPFGESIFRGNGGSLATVATTRGAYAGFDFGGPAINQTNQVGFAATLDAGQQGIFTGPEPVRDRVILAGDPLAGATATSFISCREAINNRGRLAFLAFLDDGRAVIVRAVPPGQVP